MKNFLIIAFITITQLSFSQRLKAIDSLDYRVMISKNSNNSFRNTMDIGVYKAIDGNHFKAGDTLVLGPTNEYYKNVFYGKPSGVFLKGIRYVESRYQNYQVVIEKIQFYKGNMGLENYVYAYVIPLPNRNFTIIDDVITVSMFDRAIETGEVFPLHPTRPLTRDEAIQRLKDYKEEFDLGIITQDEFNDIKEQLLEIIKSYQ